MTIRPIQTFYRGAFFRSRTEARWAVYFDVIGLKWQYEREGYILDGIYYLPDFWMPDVSMWAEVKAGEFSEHEIEKANRLVIHTKSDLILLDGPPACRSYLTINYKMLKAKENHTEYEFDVVLSMYKNYPIFESRFFTCTGFGRLDEESFKLFNFDDVRPAVFAANSCRFEHQERDLRSLRKTLGHVINNIAEIG